MNRPRIESPARTFGNVAGASYLALGVVGLAITGLDGFTSPQGAHLWVLEINPLHNVVHVLLGAGLVLGASRSRDDARTATLVTAAALGSIGLLGLALGGAETPLALNTADNVAHLVTAVAATTAWAIDRRRTPQPRCVRA